jgi:hypothetical protein
LLTSKARVLAPHVIAENEERKEVKELDNGRNLFFLIRLHEKSKRGKLEMASKQRRVRQDFKDPGSG